MYTRLENSSKREKEGYNQEQVEKIKSWRWERIDRLAAHLFRREEESKI